MDTNIFTDNIAINSSRVSGFLEMLQQSSQPLNQKLERLREIIPQGNMSVASFYEGRTTPSFEWVRYLAPYVYLENTHL